MMSEGDIYKCGCCSVDCVFFFFESVHLVSSLDLVASLSTFVSFFSLNFSFVAVSLHPYFLFPSPVVQTYALRE